MSRGFVAAAFAVTLFACGGGSPAVYVVAVDTSPIAQLPGSCFTTGTAPTQNQTVTGVFEPQRWTHWKGPDSEYLEVPSLDSRAFKLGDADWVTVSGLVGGDGKTFTAQRVITSNQNQTPNTRTETLTFKVESLGDSLSREPRALGREQLRRAELHEQRELLGEPQGHRPEGSGRERAVQPVVPRSRPMRSIVALSVACLVAGCGAGSSGGELPPNCTPAEFQAHPAGSTSPCSSGQAGVFGSALRIEGNMGYLKVPIQACGASGAGWAVEGQGQDLNVSTAKVGFGRLAVCGDQGPGTYHFVGSSGIAVDVQLSEGSPHYVAAEDTDCTVCINPDGSSGGYTCKGLHRQGDTSTLRVEANGSFDCAT